ncbi:MAG TPA: hypothetical protein VF383_11105 [Candidatus Dormibacteraeota bacterium]
MVEIDIDWFGSPPWDRSLERFLGRTRSLLQGKREVQGVCFNVGWLADIVTEWTGDPEQRLPLRSRRFAHWATLSYADLRDFFAKMKSDAARIGLPDLRLGVLVAGLGQVVAPPDDGSMYDLYSSWYERHPELYPLDISPLPGPDLDPRVPLKRDGYAYATRPQGLQEGEPFPEFFGAQWGSVAKFLGLDFIHLRDGFFGPLLYTRCGPYGTTASADPAENHTWTDAVKRLFRACKEGNPDGLVIAYSSGISGTAEWLAGCVDLEEIVADGALDVFIDQTWGGAWQDWWDDTWKGWTFQLAYLLGHAAQIAAGNERRDRPCRHYLLIETWDGWEPWDTLHDTPEKLRWAIWAFTHATVIGAEDRLIARDGIYISWMNDWNDRLIGEEEVSFLTRHLDAAEASAAQIDRIFGPLLVHNRAGLLVKAQTTPGSNASEWAEDYAGMALKWGLPVLAASTPQWMPKRWPEGALVQLARGLDVERLEELGGPVISTGRADFVGTSLLERAGVAASADRLPSGYTLGRPASSDLPREERVHLPERVAVTARENAWVGYEAGGSPVLTAQDRFLYWQPPDLADPTDPLVPHSQIGTVSPYVEAVRAMQARTNDGVRIEPAAASEPVTFSCWSSGGIVHVLLGNLESGWMGDSRFSRRVTVILPRARLGLQPATAYALHPDGGGTPYSAHDGGAEELRFTIDVPPQGCVVARLETSR